MIEKGLISLSNIITMRLTLKKIFELRKIWFALALLTSHFAFAQPQGYYNSALGLNGNPLRLALYNIIKNATQLTYTPGLWNAYYTTDVHPGTNKVWDIYSDNPNGTAAYYYILGSNQCGNGASHENSCYNREHIWPQSKFGSKYPMYSDLWIAYPTDYYINGQRSNMPYGTVGTATQTFTNGTKIGNNIATGAPATNCFEPIDSFKGDIARSYFYIVTRYLADSNNFSSWEMASGINLQPWAIQLLLAWHHLDPVSKKEKDRNDAAYAIQQNRNPFIDFPIFADCIWGTSNCSSLSIPNIGLTSSFTIFPNPAHQVAHLQLPESTLSQLQSAEFLNLQGQVLWKKENGFTTDENIDLSAFAKGMYWIRLRTSNNVLVTKLAVD